MANDYISKAETILLMLLLTGPVIFIGLISQFSFYKYKRIFLVKKRVFVFTSLAIAPVLLIILSFLVWMQFPMLASNALDGIGTKPFFPAVIVSIIIYPLISWLTIVVCQKS